MEVLGAAPVHAQSEARWRCGAMFRGGYGEGGSSSDSADAYYDAVEGDEDGAVTGSAASGSGRPAIFVTAPLSGGKAARVTKIECNGGGADDETGASGDDASLLASADRREGARGTAAATLSDAEVAVIRRKSGEDDDRVAVSNFQAASGESHGHPLATLVSRGALSSPDSILSYTSGTSDEGERGSQSSLLAGSIALSLQSEGLYSDRPKKIKVRLVEKMRTEFGKLVLIQQLGSVPRVSSSGDSALPEGGSRHSRSATADLGTSTSLPSLNGSHVASSDDVGEREEGGEQRGWERGPRAIFSVKFSPDGNYLAASGEDGVIRLWKLLVEDAMAAQEEERSDGHLRDGNESDAADGGSAEGEGGRGEYRPPRMASIFRQEPVQEFRGHTGAVLDMSWSKNNFLLSASMDQSVRLWHYSRPDCLGIFRHPDFVTSVAFHPRDDRIFITGSLDCRLRLWSIAERSVRSWNELPANNFITAVSFTSSGKYALAGTTTGVCLLVETEGFRYSTQIHVHSTRGRNKIGKKICSIEAMPGKSGEEKILISTNDSRLRLYTLRDKTIISKFVGHTNDSSQIRATFSDDGEYIISGSEDNKVFIWSVENRYRKKSLFGSLSSSSAKERVKACEFFEAHSKAVTCAIFAPSSVRNRLQGVGLRPVLVGEMADGHIIVAADLNGQVKVYENSLALEGWLAGR